MDKTSFRFSFDESNAESFADIVLCTALDIGEHLLKNGAEVSRVEDTIERICFAYGAAHVESFSITTLIVANARRYFFRANASCKELCYELVSC